VTKAEIGWADHSATTGPQRSLPRLASRLLPRPELEARLNEWAPLTVVRGLHGSGKTTLVATWLDRPSMAETMSVWVAAQPPVDGVETFEDCLSRSLGRINAVTEPPCRVARTNGLDELDEALLSRPSGRTFILVIDNFHNLVDKRVLAALLVLVERHRHFHLYVCCRGRHPIESMAAGALDVNVIEPRELLLRVEEIVELAETMGTPMGGDEAHRLRDDVGGWVSAIRMALTSHENADPAPTFEEHLQTILSDIADASVLADLIRFSLTEHLSRPLFLELSDDPDPEQRLSELEATGLVERVGGVDETLFAIPSSIRDELRKRYASQDPAGSRQFHRRLSEWFSAHGDGRHTTTAFRHAVTAEHWELMDRIWSENLDDMIREDPRLVGPILDTLPAETIAVRPSMLILRDVLRVAASDTDADGWRATKRSFVDGCERLVQKHWDTMSANDLLIVATGYIMQLRLLGRFQDSAAFGNHASAKVSSLASTQEMSPGRLGLFHLHRAVTYSMMHDDASAIHSYGRAWEQATGSTSESVLAHAAANLALTYAMEGDTGRAATWSDRHRSFNLGEWPGASVISIGDHLAAGFMALDRLDEEEVRRQLEHLGDGSAALEMWPFIAYLYAQHALYSGSAHQGWAQLHRMEAAQNDDVVNKGVSAVLMTRARADLLIASGKGPQAKRLLADQGMDSPLNRVPVARIQLLDTHDAPATESDPLTWDPATSRRDRLEMLLLSAVTARRRDDIRSAQRLVNQALELYGETGILRPFASLAEKDLGPLLDLGNRELTPADRVRLAGRSPVYPEELVFLELSDREQAVLEALAGTASRQAIADSLFVSVNTVKSQLSSIHQKLGSSTREETLTLAREHELLPVGMPE
jgi:LuxR family maltose regulon positive regulatory protein